MRRLALACALAFTASIHLALTPEHLHEMPVLGALFIPATVLAALASVLVLVRPDDRRAMEATLALLVVLVVGYVPFVVLHVPYVQGTPEPFERIAIVCKVDELVGVALALSLLRRGSRFRSSALAPLVAAAAAALGILAPQAFADPGTRSISMQMNMFTPARLVAVAGDRVTWSNGDVRTHDVAADDGSFDSGRLGPGMSFTTTLAPGIHPYHCTIHRFMRGTVEVDAIAFSGPVRARFRSTATFRGLAPAGVTNVAIETLGPDGSWHERQQVPPGADGAFSVSLPAEHLTLRARAGALTSPEVELRVSPSLLLHSERGQVTLAADPAQPGAIAVLERYDRFRFRWERVATARLDGASHAGFAVPSARRTYLRARLVRALPGFASATSGTIVVP